MGSGSGAGESDAARTAPASGQAREAAQGSLPLASAVLLSSAPSTTPLPAPPEAAAGSILLALEAKGSVSVPPPC